MNEKRDNFNDEQFEKNWASLVSRVSTLSMDEIAGMTDIDPHGRIMLLSLKKGIMTRALEEEHQRAKKEGT